MEFAALLHLLNCLFSQIALGCAIIFFENGLQLTLFHLTGLLLSEGKAVFLTALVPSQWHVLVMFPQNDCLVLMSGMSWGPSTALRMATGRHMSQPPEKLMSHSSSRGIKVFRMGRRGFLPSELQCYKHSKVKQLKHLVQGRECVSWLLKLLGKMERNGMLLFLKGEGSFIPTQPASLLFANGLALDMGYPDINALL